MKKLVLAACAAIVLVSLLACGGTPPPAGPAAAGIQAEAAPAAAQAAPVPVAPAPAPATPYFTGDGGRGRRIAVMLPDAVGLPAQYSYLPDVVQGVLVRDLTRFSAMEVLDRIRVEAVMMELEEAGLSQGTDDFFRQRAHIANVDYFLHGNITRTATGHTLQFQVVGGREANLGLTRAAFTESLTVAQMDDHTGIHRASTELLTGMGISLTDRARTELGRAEARHTINAEVFLAQGINAERAGTVVEALSRYIQATQHDPTLGEAVSRLNVLTASVQSGNIRYDVRNEIRWRNEWLATIAETNAFFLRYVSQRPPLNLVYTTDITQGNIDFQRGTVELTGITVALYPDLAWFQTINMVLDTVREGLAATGRSARWEIRWPASGGDSGLAPFVPHYNAFWATVEIVNDQGRVLSSQQVGLPYGWGVQNHRLVPIAVAPVRLTFPGVNPDHVTDRLTVRIANINGIPAGQAAAQSNISIMTQSEFSQRPDSDFQRGVPFTLVSYNGTVRSHFTTHPISRFGNISLHGDLNTREIELSGSARIHIISPTVTRVSGGGTGGDMLVIPPSVRNTPNLELFPHVVIGANVTMDIWAHHSAASLGPHYNNFGRRAGIYTRQGSRHDHNATWSHRPPQVPPVGAAPVQAAAAIAPAAPPAQAAPSTPASGFMYVTADALNVRSGPSTNHAIAGSVTRGTRVQLLGANGNWRRIRTGNTEGYVSINFLAASAPAAAPPPAAPPPAAEPQRGLLDRAADFLFGR